MDKKNKLRRTKVSTKNLILTLGELFLLERRSKGFTQRQMAMKLSLTEHFYKLLEYDIQDTEIRKISFLKALQYIDTSRELLPYEKCLIYRRRAGISQEELAEKIKISRYWLNQMEIGKIPLSEKLKNHWKL